MRRSRAAVSGGLAPVSGAATDAWNAGRFVPFFRNRPIGEERVRASGTAGGGLRLEIETALSLPRLSLRQSVIAEFDPVLRPERCAMTAELNSQSVQIEVEVDRDRARTHSWFAGRAHKSTIELAHPPLLLIDNCFSIHALAGMAAMPRAHQDPTFLSIPASLDVTVTAPGVSPVSLGGKEFGLPDVTLNLTLDLQEHLWIDRGWVTRLLIPQAHMGADWIRGHEGGGGVS